MFELPYPYHGMDITDPPIRRSSSSIDFCSHLRKLKLDRAGSLRFLFNLPSTPLTSLSFDRRILHAQLDGLSLTCPLYPNDLYFILRRMMAISCATQMMTNGQRGARALTLASRGVAVERSISARCLFPRPHLTKG